MNMWAWSCNRYITSNISNFHLFAKRVKPNSNCELASLSHLHFTSTLHTRTSYSYSILALHTCAPHSQIGTTQTAVPYNHVRISIPSTSGQYIGTNLGSREKTECTNCGCKGYHLRYDPGPRRPEETAEKYLKTVKLYVAMGKAEAVELAAKREALRNAMNKASLVEWVRWSRDDDANQAEVKQLAEILREAQEAAKAEEGTH